MLIFPQLVDWGFGAVSGDAKLDPAHGRQYAGRREHGGVTPIRTRRRRDGRLQRQGLTLAEWTAIEALFEATSGMWQTFTFLDPAGNLLEQSENFGAAAWTNGALIELTAGVDRSFGTTRATGVTNAACATEGVAQTLAFRGTFNIA